MKKTQPLGLTNKIFVKKNHLYKKSIRSSDYFLNRADEKKFYETFSQELFLKVPNTIKKAWGHWWSVMPFYRQASTLPKTELTTEQLKIVKDLIDKLHNLQLDLTIFDPQEFLNLFIKKIGLLPTLECLWPRIQEIIHDYYFDNHTLVVSHNDLIRENFLMVDGEYFLIDFEYVSLNHYLFDYASFISEALDEQEGQRFKDLLKLNAHESKKLNDLILYQNFLWAHWAQYMLEKTKMPIYETIKQQKVAQALHRPKSLE
ncbi:choline/ethanolamine kinase [Entomoplasma freundtii]|uniref:Choline kinase n=1 Tax=Entomoplasma freundtii TaxID=74700 RepID=A0A2K8NRR1_9MOLU|nr:phosphotransferase [Entomoplasma freundtii]ATZ16467.1 choline kinase [Entomoplasma freundtii]TDY55996.1 choline/ethanolamine kinase [Entomoplasma freundtii]